MIKNENKKASNEAAEIGGITQLTKPDHMVNLFLLLFFSQKNWNYLNRTRRRRRRSDRKRKKRLTSAALIDCDYRNDRSTQLPQFLLSPCFLRLKKPEDSTKLRVSNNKPTSIYYSFILISLNTEDQKNMNNNHSGAFLLFQSPRIFLFFINYYFSCRCSHVGRRLSKPNPVPRWTQLIWSVRSGVVLAWFVMPSALQFIRNLNIIILINIIRV